MLDRNLDDMRFRALTARGLALSLVLVLVGGALLTWTFIRSEDKTRRAELLRAATVVSEAVHPRMVSGLSGTSADTGAPAYLRLKSQLRQALQLYPDLRHLAVFGTNHDGAVFTFADSEVAGAEAEYAAGEVPAGYSEELLQVFEDRIPRVFGPNKSETGVSVLAIVPLVEGQSKHPVALMALEYEAKDWARQISRAGALPAALTLIVMLILLAGNILLASQVRRQRAALRGPGLEAILTAILGLTLSIGAATIVFGIELKDLEDQFMVGAANRSRQLSERLEYLRYMELEGLASFFEGSHSVETSEFTEFTAFLKGSSSVLAWEWTQPVDDNGLTELEQQMRDQGLDNFTVWHRGPDGERCPPVPGKLHYPVMLVSSPERLKSILGFDLGSEQVRRLAIEEALRSGLPTASDPVLLDGSISGKLGMLAFRPVFADSHQDTPRGLAIAVVEFQSLLDHSVHQSKNEGSGNIASYELCQVQNDKCISLATSSNDAHLHDSTDGWALVRPIFVLGKVFGVIVRDTGIPLSAVVHAKAMMVFLIGLLLTAAISMLIGSLASRRQELGILVDRRTAELAAAQKRAEDIIRGTRAGTWEWNVQTGETTFNEMWAQIIGYSLEELQPVSIETWMKFAHPGDLELSGKLLEKHFSGELPFYECEARMRHKDGSWVWVHDRGTVSTWTEDGKPLIMSGTHMDITARKQAEAALLENELLLTRTGEMAKVGGWDLDLDSNTLRWTEQTKLIHEVDTDYVPTVEAALNFYAPEAMQQMMAAVEECISKGKPYRLEMPLVTRFGRRIWVRTEGQASFLNGKPTHLFGTIQDITERREVQEALSAALTQLRGVLDAASQVSIIATDPNGLIKVFNTGAEQMLGYTAEEMIDRQTPAIIHLLDEVDAYANELSSKLGKRISGFETFVALARSGRHDCRDWTYVRKDGTHLTVNLMVTAVRNEQGEITGFLGIALDITEAKRNEVRLSEYAKEMERQNNELDKALIAAEAATQAKSEFLARMSHEIRTPMNGVLGMTELLLDTPLTSEQQDFAETVLASGKSLLTVINDILDFSKIEAGKLELENIKFDLRHTAESVLELLSFKAAECSNELVLDMDPKMPSSFRGDPGRIRQILLNLVSNAVKFTDNGEVVLSIAIEDESESGVLVHFAVRDSGPGIAEESLSTLFSAFHQIDASTTRKYGGTGLGLAISKQLTELMGGNIGVESELGKGSTFWFTVRLKMADESSPFTPVDSGELIGKQALIVDDNETNREILRRQLASWGVSARTAASGAEALQLLRELPAGESPAFAIIDSHMPVMAGEELGRMILQLEQHSGLPLIMLTSGGRKGEAARLKEAGFAGYLTKPVKQSVLLACICTVLGISQSQEASEAQEIVTSHVLSEARLFNIQVLLVEDNPVNQKLALRLLTQFGCEIELARNGVEALELIRRRRFDLVFMDCQMPVMDGYDATREIRRLSTAMANVPVVAMTANAMEGDREACLKAGMDDYISKPIDKHAVKAALMRWTGSQPAGEPETDDVPQAEQTILANQQQAAKPADVQKELPRITTLFAEAETINIAASQARAGSMDFWVELMGVYLEETQRLMRELQAAIAAADSSSVRVLAHTIKGSSAEVMAEQMRQLALEVEKTAGSGDLESAGNLFQELSAAFEKLSAQLDPELLVVTK